MAVDLSKLTDLGNGNWEVQPSGDGTGVTDSDNVQHVVDQSATGMILMPGTFYCVEQINLTGFKGFIKGYSTDANGNPTAIVTAGDDANNGMNLLAGSMADSLGELPNLFLAYTDGTDTDSLIEFKNLHLKAPGSAAMRASGYSPALNEGVSDSADVNIASFIAAYTYLPDKKVIGNDISLVSGSTYKLTSYASAFDGGDVGKDISIAWATNSANNGTFTITAVPSATEVEYTNASGVAETTLVLAALDDNGNAGSINIEVRDCTLEGAMTVAGGSYQDPGTLSSIRSISVNDSRTALFRSDATDHLPPGSEDDYDLVLVLERPGEKWWGVRGDTSSRTHVRKKAGSADVYIDNCVLDRSGSIDVGTLLSATTVAPIVNTSASIEDCGIYVGNCSFLDSAAKSLNVDYCEGPVELHSNKFENSDMATLQAMDLKHSQDLSLVTLADLESGDLWSLPQELRVSSNVMNLRSVDDTAEMRISWMNAMGFSSIYYKRNVHSSSRNYTMALQGVDCLGLTGIFESKNILRAATGYGTVLSGCTNVNVTVSDMAPGARLLNSVYVDTDVQRSSITASGSVIVCLSPATNIKGCARVVRDASKAPTLPAGLLL